MAADRGDTAGQGAERVSGVRLTASERDEIAGHCFNVWADTDDSTSDNDAHDRFRAEVAPWVEAILAARLAPVEALVYASDDGTEYEHNGHSTWEGEPECPACWASSLRAALASQGEKSHDETRWGR